MSDLQFSPSSSWPHPVHSHTQTAATPLSSACHCWGGHSLSEMPVSVMIENKSYSSFLTVVKSSVSVCLSNVSESVRGVEEGK